LQTNKQALQTKATTCRAQSAYRKTFSNGLPRLQQKLKQHEFYLPEDQFVYGKPNRPSTPVGDVISNYYGEKASKQLEEKYDFLRESTKPLGLRFARGHTKASALAHNFISQSLYSKSFKMTTSSKDVFKMKKFQNVPPRTDTHNRKRPTTAVPTSAKLGTVA
jgi:hypothetical protein